MSEESYILERYTFIPELLSQDLSAQRHAMLTHPLWRSVIAGTATRKQLQVFALQDDWLVAHSPQIEALLLAHAPNEVTRQTLLGKWAAKGMFASTGEGSIQVFGKALGLSQQDFDNNEPLGGCAALTMHFYYTLSRYGFLGLLASVAASESIFIHLCDLAGPALRQHYGLSNEQVAFFPLHERLKTGVEVGEVGLLRQLCRTPQDRQVVTEAVKLTYECERLFYDTVYAAE